MRVRQRSLESPRKAINTFVSFLILECRVNVKKGTVVEKQYWDAFIYIPGKLGQIVLVDVKQLQLPARVLFPLHFSYSVGLCRIVF